ncbi:MAG: GWxTD domain-containing protein [Gemmatimonadales bacterium]
MRPWFPILLLAVSSPPLLSGQSPSDRAELDRFRDSLAGIHDTSSLRTLQRSLRGFSDRDPTAALRFALVALRRADLGADPSAGDARDELKRLVRRAPDWPVAWHLLARAERRRSQWERADSLALGNRVGTGSLERALDDERRALNADPHYLTAALALADLALELHDTALYVPARDALRSADRAGSPAKATLTAARSDPKSSGPVPPTEAPGAGPRTPDVDSTPVALLLARGRLERATDQPDSALESFERAAGRQAAPGPDSAADARDIAVALLEYARTALAADSTRRSAEAERLYYTGADSDDSAVVAGYRADLAPIAGDSALTGFDATHGAERALWLQRFWTDRDRAELRQDGERLREHYRRLLYARRHFALTVAHRFYGPQDAYHSGSAELDDRGVIYVRHGEPATRLKPFVFGLMPNETWRYGRADGDLLFHFSAGYDDSGGGDLYDYRLVESVLDLRGAADAPDDQLLLSRATLSPLYNRMLHWGPTGAARARAHERGIGRASIEYGTTTDSYELQFAHRLTVYGDMVAVGHREGMPLAQFVFAVGAAGTTPAPEIGGVSYQVRARAVALDQTGHAVAHADTTLDFRLDRPLIRGQYLIGRVELPLPPGAYVWRAAVSEGTDAGAVLPRDSVRVDSGRGLSLSDLALGIRAASARWQPVPGDIVLLTPFDLFLAGSQVELYYEAAGAHPDTPYRHAIAVFRVRDDDRAEERPVVTLRVDEPARADVIRAHRTLQLANLKPGRYQVEVRVTGPRGETAVRRRDVTVVRAER